MRYWNGSLISSNEHPTALSAASGIYDLTSQQVYKALNRWPFTTSGIVLTDLVLYLDAGESASYPGTGTTWNDLSNSANNGTINGPTYSTASGGVFDFDGSNDSVTTSDMFDPNSDFTLNAWVNQDGSTTNTIISRSSGSGALQIRLNNNQVQIVDSFSTNVGTFTGFTASTATWYNICVTRSSNTYSLYVDGSFVSSFTSSNSYGSAANAIGTNSAASNEYFDGKIAAVLAYTRALSATEILDNHGALVSRFP